MSDQEQPVDRDEDDNEARERALFERFRTDFPFYAPRALRIRTKAGEIKPLRLNAAQLRVHEEIEAQRAELGRVRVLVLKGRQQGVCYAPHMRVLTADYRWVPIGELAVGDRLIACDENYGELNAANRRLERRVRTATVEAKVWHRREAFEIVLATGTKLVATGAHRHLCRQRGGDVAQWRSVSDMRVGDDIRAFCHSPEENITFEDGWFGGLLDGEGSFAASPAVRIALHQVAGPVLERAKKYLNDLGIAYYELIDRRQSGSSSKLGQKEVHCLRVERCADIIRILTRTRPTRFVAKEVFIGKKLPKSFNGFDAWSRVVSIIPVGEQDVVDIQTSEKTFICEGLVSHNSTYVQARYFWRVTHRRGARAFILTHEDKATANLFNMTERFYQNCPPELAPVLGNSNAKELQFAKLDSGYGVGTAGSKGVGRSDTIQFFHGSEVAYWSNAEMHVSGALQTVADVDNTEVILESTSAGPVGVFYDRCMAALRGETDYRLIFIAWFMQPEYRRAVPAGFEMTGEEQEYAERYELDLQQIAWRRAKVRDLGGMHNFRREYPATVTEAFLVEAIGALWKRALLDNCRVAEAPEMRRVVVAVDPSGGSGKRNDEVGIVVAGLGVDGRGYILEDASGRYSPIEWGNRAVGLYERYQADRIIAEKNFGGDMVEANIRAVNSRVPFKAVVASRGKQQRAEPVVALYESGRVAHLGMLAALEDEQVSWVPGVTTKSPNRIDACVFAITELMLGETKAYDASMSWASGGNVSLVPGYTGQYGIF